MAGAEADTVPVMLLRVWPFTVNVIQDTVLAAVQLVAEATDVVNWNCPGVDAALGLLEVGEIANGA